MTTPIPAARPLGSTGMAFSPIGLGTSWMPGLAEEDLLATMHHALAAGVNWIDTAPIYRLGLSERLVGRLLARLPEAERPFVVTKCGLTWEEPADEYQPDLRHQLDAASVRRELDASLRRLGVERLDLYLVHWPPTDPPTALDEYWQALVDLREDGKVRAIGLSNHDAAQLAQAARIGRVDAIEPPFSAIDRTAAAELAWCAGHEAGALVYSPLGSGLLTGAWNAARLAALQADDWRRSAPEFTDGLAANLALADALVPIAERHGVSRAAVAIAWALAWPGVTGVIAGAHRPEQVDGWIAGAGLRLSADELDAVRVAIERTGAGAGPSRPA